MLLMDFMKMSSTNLTNPGGSTTWLNPFSLVESVQHLLAKLLCLAVCTFFGLYLLIVSSFAIGTLFAWLKVGRSRCLSLLFGGISSAFLWFALLLGRLFLGRNEGREGMYDFLLTEMLPQIRMAISEIKSGMSDISEGVAMITSGLGFVGTAALLSICFYGFLQLLSWVAL